MASNEMANSLESLDLQGATLDWLNAFAEQGVLTTDADLKICGWNRWLEIKSGRKAAEMLGRNLLEAYPEMTARRLEQYYRDALAGQVRVLSQRFHGFLIPMPPSNDEETFAHMQQSARIAPLVKGERIIGTITVIDDVTERVLREAELQSQVLALEALHDIGRGILLLDLPDCLQRIVDKTAAFVNAPLAALVLKQDRDIKIAAVNGDQHQTRNLNIDDIASIARMAVRNGQTTMISDQSREAEIKPLNPDSHSSLAVPLMVEENVIGAMIIESFQPMAFSKSHFAQVSRLATQAALAIRNAQLYEAERYARREAEIANRTKDEFLATVSHELRTPLTALLGWTRLLRTGKLDDSSFTRALETIERNARAQAQLIEDLLDISRIITGKLRLEVRSLDLSVVIEAAIDAVRPAADAKHIRLQVVLDPRAGTISGDPDRLQQVIWNLLSNAIKFTPSQGNVRIELVRVGANAEIQVIDSGQGIATDFLPYVFDRFRQADSKTTRAHGGLGLGLAIVRHLVELHGGTVNAESAGEGKGATFAVRLPLMALPSQTDLMADNSLAAFVDDQSSDEYPDLKGLRIMVVDDEPDARELLCSVLLSCGAEVEAVESVAGALVKLASWQPNILVSDIGMPGEDGYSLMRKIRALPVEQGGRIPAIALTAFARAEDRKKALMAGFQVHVPKPIEPVELCAVVASLAGRL